MKTAAMAVIGLFLTATLTACGGGTTEADAEKDARAELKELGLSTSLTDCAIDGIKEKAGSLKEYTELSTSKQQTIAATAGADCAKDLTDEEVGDLGETLEGQRDQLKEPAARKAFITGMTSQGIPEDVANCIVDKIIEDEVPLTDMADPTVMGQLAQECA